MQFEFARVDREGPLTIISLNRPEVLNALHAMAHYELDAIFNDFANDPAQWVGIVTGSGRAFSTGNDLKYEAAGGRTDRPPSGFACLTERHNLTKPLIAAVNGPAMGGGLEIALCCDVVLAAERAVFALPEPKVGLGALAGGPHRLPRTIGIQPAMGMILTGRHVSPEEGRQMGFVNAVVPNDQLMDEARRWAGMMLDSSPLSLRASKEAVFCGLSAPTLPMRSPRSAAVPPCAACCGPRTTSKDPSPSPRSASPTGRAAESRKSPGKEGV